VRKGHYLEFEKVKGRVKRDYEEEAMKAQEDSLFNVLEEKYHVEIFNKEEK